MEPLDPRGAEIERAVQGYAAAWNEDDDAELQRILKECFAEDGIVESNFEEIRGRKALFERISTWRRQVPGCRAVFTSAVEHHHNVFRFTLKVIRPDGEDFSPAMDIETGSATGPLSLYT